MKKCKRITRKNGLLELMHQADAVKNENSGRRRTCWHLTTTLAGKALASHSAAYFHPIIHWLEKCFEGHWDTFPHCTVHSANADACRNDV